MKIAFTICSNNYLAQARSFKESLQHHNPDYTFFLGLVDQVTTQVDYSWLKKEQIIAVEELRIENFEQLWKSMDIVEFNTCVKPAYFKYFVQRFPEAEIIFYFDPDIYVYDSLLEMESEFKNCDILLTPHILSPIPMDGRIPGENLFLNYGLYNLGFLGLKLPSENTAAFLNWWEERCMKMGYNRPQDGLFVDQLWINLVPLYFDKVAVLKRYGYNMGPWNLHERKILLYTADKVILNDDKSLVFYHFSSYSYKSPQNLSKFYNRIRFSDSVDLGRLYDAYTNCLKRNNIEFFETVPCYYVVEKRKIEENKSVKAKWVRKSKDLIINLLPYFIVNEYRRSRNQID